MWWGVGWGCRREYRRGSEILTDRFPKRVPKALAFRSSPENLFFITNIFNMGEQEWQSACLPPVWLGLGRSFWFSPLLREVFLRVLRFSPLLKNQFFQIPTSSHELRSAKCFLWVTKLCLSLFILIQVSSTKFVVFPYFHATRSYLKISLSFYHLD